MGLIITVSDLSEENRNLQATQNHVKVLSRKQSFPTLRPDIVTRLRLTSARRWGIMERVRCV